MKKLFLVFMFLLFTISVEAQWDRIFVKDSMKLGSVWINPPADTNSLTVDKAIFDSTTFLYA